MVERPSFWLGIPLAGSPRPWREFPWHHGLMPNAFDILSHPELAGAVRLEGIARRLRFEGRIALDSGGYKFSDQNTVTIGAEEILALYRDCRPDYGVVLDHPLSPGLGRRGRISRQAETLANTAFMVEHSTKRSPALIPVIHGHHPKSLGLYIKRLLEIMDPTVVAVGSLVPSIFSTTGAVGSHQAIRALAFIRRQLPDKFLHVFGVGSIMTMHLMFYSGIDSVDSSAWRLKAAYGAIQLPGVCDRNVTGKSQSSKYKRLSKTERRLLDICRCPICRGEGLRLLRSSFTARAMHNAWVYQQEVDHAARLMHSGEYDDYVETTLGANPKFNKILGLVRKYRTSSFISSVAS